MRDKNTNKNTKSDTQAHKERHGDMQADTLSYRHGRIHTKQLSQTKTQSYWEIQGIVLGAGAIFCKGEFSKGRIFQGSFPGKFLGKSYSGGGGGVPSMI